MVERLRIGMIGCGQIAAATAAAIHGSSKCVIQAVMDIDKVAAAELATKYAVPYSLDMWEFLARDDVDAVYIATPHGTHASICVAAARAGKHVMVEKPMATHVRDAQMMVRECQAAGVKLSAAMPSRYGSHGVAHDLVAKGAVGDIVSTRILQVGHKTDIYWTHGVGGRARQSLWRGFWGMSGGGILIMNAVHAIDALRYATGLTAVEVTACGGTYASPAAVEDAIGLLVRYQEGNAYGVIEAMSWAPGGSRDANGTWIYGTKGQIRLAGRHAEVYTTVEGLGLQPNTWQPLPEGPRVDGRVQLMDDFASAISEGREPFITGEDGVAVVQLMLAAYQSMETGQPVRLATA